MIASFSMPAHHDPASLEEIAAQGRLGVTLVVLDSGAKSLEASLKTLLNRTDSEFLAFEPQLLSCPADGAGLAAQVRSQEGWDEKPHWILLDAKAHRVDQGTQAPSADRLVTALRAAGVRSPLEQMEAFLQEHGDRLDVLCERLKQRMHLADTRMGLLLNLPARTAEQPDPKPRVLPSAEQDERIWGEAAAGFRGLMDSGAWALVPDGTWFMTRTASFSPLMRAEAERALPGLEAVLRRYPHHWVAWCLWSELASWLEDHDSGPFLDSLVPLPGKVNFPPTFVLEDRAKAARKRGDWAAVAKVEASLWKTWQTSQFTAVGSDPNQGSMLDRPWNDAVSPLLEALLKCGRVPEADGVLEEALAWSGRSRFARLASELATRCERPDVAQRWAQLETSFKPRKAAPSAGNSGPKKSRTELLEDLVKAEPSLTMAQEALLGAFFAERKAQAASPRQGDPGAAGDAAPKDLDPAQDEAQWGPSSRLLGRILQDDFFLLGCDEFRRVPTEARRSPLMRAAIGKVLPILEQQLERIPEAADVWMLWAGFNGCLPSPRPMRDLLASIVPKPGSRSDVPIAAMELFNEEAVAAKDWPGIVAITGTKWEEEVASPVNPLEASMKENSPGADWMVGHAWDLWGPLVEARLRLGDSQAASQVVQSLYRRVALKGVLTRASALALACHHPELASAWNALSTTKLDKPKSVTMGK